MIPHRGFFIDWSIPQMYTSYETGDGSDSTNF